MGQPKAPAPRACASCPYRRDVPSGVWHADEYDKLRKYDAPTGAQPMSVFLCHQTDRNDDQSRLCAGWCGVHGSELLSLRIAAAQGISAAVDAMTYTSDVPLFESGTAAADHGMADIDAPSTAARAAMTKIVRRRPGVVQ